MITYTDPMDDSPTQVKQPRTPEEFAAHYQSGTPASKQKLIAILSPDLRLALAPIVPKLLEKESHPEVKAALVRGFASHWPPEHLNHLGKLLFDEHLCIRIAVLDALIHIAPQKLQEYLPRLLTSPQPRIRSLAIKGLAKIDPDEAVAHLDLLLSGTSTEERLAGIQCSFLLPYAAVKAVMLKFLAAEADADLLRQAGLLFSNNPDPEVPFRVWDIAGRSSPAKRAALQDLAKQAAKGLGASGVLGDRFSEYQQQLQTWIYRREASRFIQDCIARLETPDPQEHEEILARLKQSVKQPIVRELLTEAVTWPLRDDVRAHLESCLPFENPQAPVVTPEAGEDTGKEAGAAEPEPPPGCSLEDFRQLSVSERIQHLAALCSQDATGAHPFLELVLSGQREDPLLVGAAFRNALLIGDGRFLERARTAVNHPQQKVATAALEYLAEFAPDEAFARVGTFLQASDLRMKSSAVRILKRYDLAQALSLIGNLLQSEDPEQKRMALACMVYFDFSLVRESLLAFLETIPEPPLIQAGLCLFQANPDPEHLYPLYRLEQLLPGEMGAAVLSVRRKMETALQAMGRLEGLQVTRDADFAAAWEKERRKAAAPLPAYSAKKIRAQAPPSDALTKGIEKGVEAAVGALRIAKYVAVVALIAGVIALFSYLQALFHKGPQQFTIGVPATITGTVRPSPSSEVLLLIHTADQREIRVIAGTVPEPRPGPGDEVEAQVIPQRQLVANVEVELQSVKITRPAPPESR